MVAARLYLTPHYLCDHTCIPSISLPHCLRSHIRIDWYCSWVPRRYGGTCRVPRYEALVSYLSKRITLVMGSQATYMKLMGKRREGRAGEREGGRRRRRRQIYWFLTRSMSILPLILLLLIQLLFSLLLLLLLPQGRGVGEAGMCPFRGPRGCPPATSPRTSGKPQE